MCVGGERFHWPKFPPSKSKCPKKIVLNNSRPKHFKMITKVTQPFFRMIRLFSKIGKEYDLHLASPLILEQKCALFYTDS
jgi:hypothetical protein